jgi:hypothetical protein
MRLTKADCPSAALSHCFFLDPQHLRALARRILNERALASTNTNIPNSNIQNKQTSNAQAVNDFLTGK